VLPKAANDNNHLTYKQHKFVSSFIVQNSGQTIA